MKTFELHRDTDVSGVSGTGVVAEGVVFSDGKAALHWIVGDHRSTVVWESVQDLEAIHGHGGATRIVWSDDIRADERAKIAAAIRAGKSPHYSAKYRAGIECGARIAERAS